MTCSRGFIHVLKGLFNSWGEAFKSLYRNKWISIASIGVVAVTLLMLGVFLVVRMNLEQITQGIKEQVEITLDIDDFATEDERSELRSALAANSAIAEFKYASKEESMRRLAEEMKLGDLGDSYLEPGENPLPDSYKIRPVVPERVSELARELEGYPAAGAVRYGDSEFIENLFDAVHILQIIGVTLMIALGITAVFLIAHTIRLTVFIRRREIMIMKYVGATNWFIRWPFIMEGLTIGLIGAIIPLGIINLVYQSSMDWVVAENLLFIDLVQLTDIRVELFKYLLPIGCGLGVLGSLLSMDRFLRV